MEQKTLLAVVLSLVILFIWGTLTAPQRRSVPATKSTQLIDNKRDTQKEFNTIRPEEITHPSLVSDQEIIPKDQKEETSVLENEKIRIEFSNIGGVIKKVVLKEYKKILPVSNLLALPPYQDNIFVFKKVNDWVLSYSFQDKVNGAEIVTTYEIFENDYVMNGKINILYPQKMSNQKQVNINGFTLDVSSLDNINNSSDKTLYEYSIAVDNNIKRKGNAYNFNPKEGENKAAAVKWLGFRDRYFGAVLVPEFKTDAYTINPINDKKLSIVLSKNFDDQTNQTMQQYGFAIFFGPQKIELLKNTSLGIDNFMVFSGFGLIDGIAKVIYQMMNLIHKVTKNWGISIILISVLVNMAMYPLTARGMSSMRKMQQMQPEITKLKEQYQNNPQRLNKETMELYKKHHINPLGGCLPFLLQMPVFFGAYQVIWRSVYLKGETFLWIKDLSEPDRLMIFPSKIPLIGNELNILPILMIIIMFFQQKFSSKNVVITDPSQAAQQKMMTTIFPVFIGFIFYKFSSALCLYFTCFYIISMITQVKISNAKKAE